MGKIKENNLKLVDRNKLYGSKEAIDLLVSCESLKFDQSVDVSINLGVDPRHADQLVRGTVALPAGTGKETSILVIAQGDSVEKALEAGANYAGSDEYFDKIKSGWTDIDVIIATPDMMPSLGKFGKVLGPKKLMPNPKSGTVTNDVAKAVKELKGGKIEFRVDKFGIIHAGIGKMSFGADKIGENLDAFMRQILKARPNSLKGIYIKKITLSSSMGPGIKIDKNSFTKK
jgi:large subunit ribosomal protein L1